MRPTRVDKDEFVSIGLQHRYSERDSPIDSHEKENGPRVTTSPTPAAGGELGERDEKLRDESVLAPVAALALGLEVRFFGLAPISDWNNVVHFQVDSPPASSTSSLHRAPALPRACCPAPAG